MSHGHNHNHHFEYFNSGIQLLLSMLLNLGIVLAQVVGGVLSNSLALLSDAAHNASDVLALFFSWKTQQLSQTKPTLKRTFGFRRLEVLTAFVNASALLIICSWLGYEAVIRFLHPEKVNGNLVLWMALLGLLVNGGCALLLRGEKGMNIRSAFLHLASDAVASLLVLISGILIKLFSWYFMDPLLTLLLSLWIGYQSWRLISDSSHLLLEGTPDGIGYEEVREALLALPAVEGIHELHIWGISSTEFALSAHLLITNTSTSIGTNIITEVKCMLHNRFEITHVTIELECFGGDCGGRGCSL